MEITSNQSSLPNSHHLTTNLSSTTSPSEMKSVEDKTSSYQTIASSTDYIPRSYYRTASKDAQIILAERSPTLLAKDEENQNFATSLTLEPAKTQTMNANTSTLAKNVERQDMAKGTVRTAPSEIYGLQPKYLRHNLWQESSTLSPTTAEWSERARPLVRPGLSEYSNGAAMKTILENPNLFQVKTPIKIDVFESLLRDHPNPAFVHSV